MVYTEFFTKDAEFILQVHRHDIGSQDRKENYRQLKGIDAIVLETGKNTLQEVVDYNQSNFHPQYAHAVEYAQDHSIPLFGVDVVSGIIDDLRQLFQRVLVIPHLFKICYADYILSLGETEIPEYTARKFAELTFLMQDPIVAARDAITAEKVEKYVVHRVKEGTGKEHPKISLHYGAGHVGIRYDLESQLRRKITLWNLRNLNIPRYGGYKLDDLNTVAEAHYNGHIWDVTTTVIDPPLFA